MAGTDYSSAFKGTGTDYSSAYTKPVDLGVSYGAPTAPKPFDWKGAGDALGGLMGGVGNLIRGIRGEAPIPMAGMGLGNYLQNNDQDQFLTNLISSIISKTQAESDPILKLPYPNEGRTPPLNPKGY
jgi:hypothetical protein